MYLVQILRATIETLKHFNWTKFSIIYEENGFGSMAMTLSELAKERKMKLNHFIAFNRGSELPNIFANTEKRTRSKFHIIAVNLLHKFGRFII